MLWVEYCSEETFVGQQIADVGCRLQLMHEILSKRQRRCSREVVILLCSRLETGDWGRRIEKREGKLATLRLCTLEGALPTDTR